MNKFKTLKLNYFHRILILTRHPTIIIEASEYFV